MEVLVYLVPLALMLGLFGLLGFLWSLKNGQYDDLEGAGWRAIADDEPEDRPGDGRAETAILPEKQNAPQCGPLGPAIAGQS